MSSFFKINYVANPPHPNSPAARKHIHFYEDFSGASFFNISYINWMQSRNMTFSTTESFESLLQRQKRATCIGCGCACAPTVRNGICCSSSRICSGSSGTCVSCGACGCTYISTACGQCPSGVKSTDCSGDLFYIYIPGFFFKCI